MDKKKLGELLKDFRHKENISQVELANILNTSDSMISKIERSTIPNVFLNYIYFCKSKGVDLNNIFNDYYYNNFLKEQKKNESNK